MNRRALLALAVAAVVAGAAAWLLRPEGPRRPWDGAADHQQPEASFEDPEAADPALAAAALARARARLAGTEPGDDPTARAEGRPLWLCAYAPPEQPRCARGDGPTLAEAVDVAAARLGRGGEALKLDLLLRSEPARWPEDRRPHEAGTYGIEVGTSVILPSEVLERGLFRAETEDAAPRWDDEAVRGLLRIRGAEVEASFAFRRLRTASWVQLSPDRPPVRTYRLHPFDRRDASDPEVLRAAARLAADHMASIVAPDGGIRYRWSAARGRPLPGRNMLRHAGSAYSLVQAWDAMREPAWRDAAERAIGWYVKRSRTDERHGPYGGGRVRWLPESTHVKLGGAALAAVALATWQRTTGDERWTEELREFARYLVSQQQESGEFVSFASVQPGGEPRDDVSVYYPGEAVLGLASTYAVDPDPRWLEAAIRGASWLVEIRDAGKSRRSLANDHWLMIGLSHLYRHTQDPRWLEHSLRLAEAVEWQAAAHEGHEAFHRDYAGGFYEPPRATPAATRAEGLVAVLDTCAAAGRACPEVRERLLDTIGHLLEAQYRPETAWWMPLPDRVVGGFAGGIVDPDLRNDYTQHALSALLGGARVIGAGQDGR